MQAISSKKIKSFIIISLTFFLTQIAAANPLQKVQLKIEGLHTKPWTKIEGLIGWVIEWPIKWTVEGIVGELDDENKSLIKKMESALLSVPGVKTVEFRVKKKWFFRNDYSEISAIVEFELGTITSETLILAVESASDQKHIYKVKFIE